jgi:Ni/Fe-hydrogenase subunit HybB-like protein
VWATLETLHFLGLALLVATIGVLDLRLLGVAKGLPLAPFQKLVPIGVAAFALELLTGIVFFAGAPYQYIYNVAFQMKAVFILVAGLNILIFYGAGVSRPTFATSAGQSVPRAGRLAGAVSITMWIGVMFWGRMLTFFRPPFVVPPQ